MYTHETYQYKGFIIEIIMDDDPSNPRDWDNLGTMVCWHRDYILGDSLPDRLKHRFKNWNTTAIESFERWRKINQKHLVILPVYLYDHSGITISTTPFYCPWDSGQVGWIYVTHDHLKQVYNIEQITADIFEKARQVLLGEIEIYDQYLRGDVWGYLVRDSKDKKEIYDSCFGFFGADGLEECHKQAKEAAEAQEKKQLPLLFL